MLPFRRKKEEEFFPETDDVLVIFDDDNKKADIQRISEIKEGTIYVTGKYVVPLGDCEVTTGVEGRIFFYRAPERSIIETERLAQLEKSMVLSQITAYRPPVAQASMDWTKGLLFALVFLGFIMLGLSSCSGP